MPTPRIPLAPVKKTWSRTLSGGRVCTGAVTTDAKWGMERLEDTCTTWIVVRLPDVPEDKKVIVASRFPNLTWCRRYIGSGEAQKHLERLQAHHRGEHEEFLFDCDACVSEQVAEECREETARQLHGGRAA